MSLRYLLLCGLYFFLSCSPTRKAQAPPAPVSMAERPKNIILMIGDGMALPQVSAGLYWQGGKQELSLTSKTALARQLIDVIAQRYRNRDTSKSPTQQNRSTIHATR